MRDGLETFSLGVNGRSVTVRARPETPLLYALRNDLGLVGVRFGCGEGACGACTVMIDGAPRHACQASLEEAAGRRIETVESLLAGGALHPLAQAVLELNAGQCGYCLPGVLMRAKALLDDAVASPGREEIALALAGNLCRCGAHSRILDAVERVAAMKTYA